MEPSDKPFKCPKCNLCFANSDRLAVHHLVHLKQTTKGKLKVKIPGVASENVDDQTPTPSSFLKTADVNGSPLFQDLNPFDRDFKLASNSRQCSTIEQNPEVGSTTENRHQHSVLETPQVELEDAGFPKSFSQNTESGFSYDKQGPVRSVSVIASTVEEDQQQQQPQHSNTNSNENTPSPVSSTTSENSAALLQSFLNQLKVQQQQQQQQGGVAKEQNEHPITQGSTTNTQHIVNNETRDSPQQELIREQLKSLIKSGQIKIQISPYQSSTKVQASIVGNIAVAKPRDNTTSTTSGVHQQQIQQQQQQQQLITPRSIAPKVETQSFVQSLTNKVASPMSDITTPALPTSSELIVLPGTSLQIAKQKLKQVIQQGTENEQQTIVGSYPAFKQSTVNVAGITSNIGVGGGSSQGKYRDIILKDEYGEDLLLKRKGRLTGEDSTPEEKRRRFLERNRAAASRCRQKRKIWVNQLEKKSDGLVSTNSSLAAEITALRSEVAQLKALLLAHKDCPVTQQQKALVNQIANAGTYVAVSDGQLFAIHQLASSAIREASDEEVASSALTDMAARATIEIGKKSSSGMITVQSNSDGTVTKIL